MQPPSIIKKQRDNNVSIGRVCSILGVTASLIIFFHVIMFQAPNELYIEFDDSKFLVAGAVTFGQARNTKV
jgi:hypothetical protein